MKEVFGPSAETMRILYRTGAKQYQGSMEWLTCFHQYYQMVKQDSWILILINNKKYWEQEREIINERLWSYLLCLLHPSKVKLWKK